MWLASEGNLREERLTLTHFTHWLSSSAGVSSGVTGECGGVDSSAVPQSHHGAQRLPNTTNHTGTWSPDQISRQRWVCRSLPHSLKLVQILCHSIYWWRQCLRAVIFLFYLWLAAQEPAPQENGDTDLIPRKCDIIAVTGQAEKCELARAALLVRNSGISALHFVLLWIWFWSSLSCLFLPLLFTLKALVPVTIDVEVSYDLHRYIIGQKGIGIRKMMEEYEVDILYGTLCTLLFKRSVWRFETFERRLLCLTSLH